MPTDDSSIIPFPPPGDAPVAPNGSKLLTKETLTEYQEELLVRNAKKLLPALMKNLKTGLENGSSKTAEQVMALYGYTRSAPGVVINNMLQQNVNQGDDSEVYFEKIIRKLEERDRPSGTGNILEAEVVE